MADFNLIPSGQVSSTIPASGATLVASSANPVWVVPEWPVTSASAQLIIDGGGGGGAAPVTLPSIGQVWPIGAFQTYPG